MPRVINIIVGSGAVGCKFNGNAAAVRRTGGRIVQLETTLNDGRAAAATAAAAAIAVGGQGPRRAGTGEGVDTRADRPLSTGTMPSDWSVVFRSYAGLVNTSLTNPLLHAEAADPVALVNTLKVDETMLEASLGFYHLLLLTTGPALDKVTTSGDGEGLRAWHAHWCQDGTRS